MIKQAYILFTRIPTPNKVKTRLQAKLTGDQASEVQANLLADILSSTANLSEDGIEPFVAYSNEADPKQLLASLPKCFRAFPQSGEDIGQRMQHAFEYVFDLGYESVVLTGSDLPKLRRQTIVDAFDALKDIVLAPSLDGGYALIGCRRNVDLIPIFQAEIDWGNSSVLQQTLDQISGRKVVILPALKDVDYPKDLRQAAAELTQDSRYLGAWLRDHSQVIL